MRIGVSTLRLVINNDRIGPWWTYGREKQGPTETGGAREAHSCTQTSTIGWRAGWGPLCATVLNHRYI